MRPIALLSAMLAVSIATSAAPNAQQIASPDVLPPAEELAAAIQRKYDTVKDFTASFTQTEEQQSALKRRTTESGSVAVKKPGKMRWEYTSPQKLFVSDGRTLYMYFPLDKQVVVHAVDQHEQSTGAILFLMGRGNVTRDFTARHGDGATSDTYVVRLEPKTRQAEYDWLQLTLDRKSLQIKVLSAGNAQGGRSTFTFTNFKENAGLPDKMFQFQIPRGTEVISSGKTP
jgi:outer membrane lipoprotein carrier protein